MRFDWLARWWDYLWNVSVEDLLMLIAPRKSDRVLDVGGGTGLLASALQPLVKEIVVLDASEGMVREAKKKRVKAIRGWAEDLPFPSKTFDVVTCTDAFHHFHDQNAAVREIKRVLKRGGRLVMEEINPASFRGRWIMFFEWFTGYGSTFRTPARLKELLERNGFRVALVHPGRWVYHLRAQNL